MTTARVLKPGHFRNALTCSNDLYSGSETARTAHVRHSCIAQRYHRDSNVGWWRVIRDVDVVDRCSRSRAVRRWPGLGSCVNRARVWQCQWRSADAQRSTWNASELAVDRAGIEHSNGQGVEVAMSTDSCESTNMVGGRLIAIANIHCMSAVLNSSWFLGDKVHVEQTRVV